MSPLLLALSILLQPAPVAEEPPLPTGAPAEDYPFVAWCYGALRGYLDLHDEVMPEVTRIEGAFRKPGSSLEDDLKVYADQQDKGREDIARFQRALTVAERASMRPINQVGAEAVRRGRQVWAGGPETTPAQKAQMWMSWALPARCETVADRLEQSSILAGAALRANAEDAAPN